MALQNLANTFGLTVLLWNCRSLYANMIEFKKFISQANPHIICLTETWLKLTDTLKLQPYNIYRKDRFGKGVGSLFWLVRHSYPDRTKTFRILMMLYWKHWPFKSL